MINRKLLLLFSITLISLMLIAMPVLADEAKYFRTYFGSGDIPSIDQALVTDFIGIQLVDEMTVGIMRQNETTGLLEPGMATEYSVSDDGRVYTFKLLQNVPWVRYNPETKAVEEVKDCDGNVRYVTAHDFVYGAERTLRPETASGYAYVANLIEGAEAYNTPVEEGEGTPVARPDFSTVGIKALDDFTIEYTFKEAGVFNLNILSMWMLHAMPSWIIDGDACNEALGERWTETGFYQGYGPFTLEEWVHDSHLTIIANPFWPGTEFVPKPKIAGVHYSLIDTSAALAEYEAGNMDEAGIPSADYDRIISDPAFKDQIKPSTDSVGTEFLIYNEWLPPTDDVRIRKALSLAVDKEAVVKTLKEGIAAPFYIHPGVDGAPKVEDYPDLGIMYDPEAAKALIDEYCKEKGIQPKDIVVTYSFNTSESRKMLAETIQYMWQNTLGITVNLKNSEWPVFKVERQQGLDNVYRSTWVQDYMDANNFTADVFLCGTGYSSVTDWPSKDCTDKSNPAYIEYEEVVKKAGKETDPKARAALYARSDEIIIEEEAIINPIYWYSSLVLRKPNIIAPETLTGYAHWEKWEIK